MEFCFGYFFSRYTFVTWEMKACFNFAYSGCAVPFSSLLPHSTISLSALLQATALRLGEVIGVV